MPEPLTTSGLSRWTPRRPARVSPALTYRSAVALHAHWQPFPAVKVYSRNDATIRAGQAVASAVLERGCPCQSLTIITHVQQTSLSQHRTMA